jgi:peptidoglycan/LPS O-acetylase OafA/YrhL
VSTAASGPAARTVPPAHEGDADHGFRPDIEGLRAVAVLAVLAYHLHLSGASGGYVGVDVFFVISGFLITRQLVSTSVADRRVGLQAFYVRRMRRILPAATVVILATMAAAHRWQDPLALRLTPGDARGAALFFSNLRFESRATDYLAEADAPSIFQQFWSLSVEEQFYLVWPAAVAVLLVIATRRRWPARSTIAGGLAVVVLVSFAFSVRASSSDPTAAFFVLQSRAWELGIGGLVALLLPLVDGRRRTGWILGVLGLGALGVSIVGFDTGTTWPGWAALVPVLGTAAVIVGGRWSTGSPAARLLSLGPAQVVGRYSYSLYLWHWPVIVLLEESGDLSGTEQVLAVATTALLAAASFHLVEQPARRSSWLLQHPRSALLMGAGLILLPVAASFLLARSVPALESDREYGGVVHQLDEGPIPTDFVPADVVPPLAEASSADDPFAERNVDCDRLGDCRYGPPDADIHVVLLGDSLVGQWTPALIEVAPSRSWQVDRVSRSLCSSVNRGAGNVDCATWLDERWPEIRAARPDLVVLGGPAYDAFAADPDQWEADVTSAMRDLPPDLHVAVLSGYPLPGEDPLGCLAANPTDVVPCEPAERARSRATELNGRLRDLATEHGVGYVDLVPLLCAHDRCPVIAEDTVVFRDHFHVTSAFAASRAGDLTELLTTELAEP